MSITVKKVALSEQHSEAQGQLLHTNYLGLIGNIEVQCTIQLGTLTLTIAELRQLKVGQTLPLNQKTNEPIAIILNDQIIAKGELMSHGSQFAIQITEMGS